jgi:hypothetical protein
LSLTCESGSMFTAGRNSLEGEAPVFSRARVGDADVVAEPDGRVHVYDTATTVIEDWGSDVQAVCEGRRVIATGDRATADSVTAYELVNGAPVRVSEAVEFPGPVTALWPGVAVARNPTTGKYAAYALTVDCGR